MQPTSLMPGPPAPPQGPGVYPPFPAPPVEGRGARLWWGFGIGALVLLVVCGGGIAGVIGLTRVMSSALDEQANVVAVRYFDAVKARDFDAAYQQLCEEAQENTSQAEFVARVGAEPAITSYQVGALSFTDLSAPVDVGYANGQSGEQTVYFGQSPDTGGLEVCEVE